MRYCFWKRTFLFFLLLQVQMWQGEQCIESLLHHQRFLNCPLNMPTPKLAWPFQTCIWCQKVQLLLHSAKLKMAKQIQIFYQKRDLNTMFSTIIYCTFCDQELFLARANIYLRCSTDAAAVLWTEAENKKWTKQILWLRKREIWAKSTLIPHVENRQQFANWIGRNADCLQIWKYLLHENLERFRSIHKFLCLYFTFFLVLQNSG